MPFELVESEKFILKVHLERPFLEFTIKPGVTWTEADAFYAKLRTVEIRPNVKFYVLADGVEFFTMTKEARELSADAEFADNTRAVAFYTKSLSLALLGDMYVKMNKPAVPTRIFTDREKARLWLEQQMSAALKS